MNQVRLNTGREEESDVNQHNLFVLKEARGKIIFGKIYKKGKAKEEKKIKKGKWKTNQ